ncbi:WD40 repeat domain-containing protein [Dictyobacter formicarum]|uniref:Anaphase-promoting complex subunit 4-like WD40 domain-containing protein n=1 Tax=Dictyobacter formicarum TaxID=2778368 RepID=A0ABQ3VNL8_9CHLR|nr:WD40 repeat domain-containing protein [Dictyobacter formicarum]GHO87427.1 hypothetical protein KSZ_54330 [Dictyobacter formicarum]
MDIVVTTGSDKAYLQKGPFSLGDEPTDDCFSSRLSMHYLCDAIKESAADVVLIACTGPDYSVQIWEQRGFQMPIKRLCYQEHMGEITALAWAPDCSYLATTSEDKTLRIWNTHTGETLSIYREQPAIRALAWSPDSSSLAIGSDTNCVSILRIEEQRISAINLGHAAGIYGIDSVSWSPDGARLATVGDDNTIRICDGLTGATILTYKGHQQDQWILNAAWSPDGEWIASGADRIHIWSAKTSTCRYIYEQHDTAQHWVDAIAWSPDGRLIASSSTENVLHIWNALTGANQCVYQHPYTSGQLQGLISNALAWDTTQLYVGKAGQRLAFASCNRVVSQIEITAIES